MVQSRAELEQFHSKPDPWGYEVHEHDARRKAVLLAEIPPREYGRVLDIGCGQGFVTRDLPGRRVVGVDISEQAILHASKYASARLQFVPASLFDLTGMRGNPHFEEAFDMILITGVLYEQYVGRALTLVYAVVDSLLAPGGVLVSVHIQSWYRARFPYLMTKNIFYDYREYTHALEVYVK